MAVLVEAISVVVRREAIDSLFPGGWPAFLHAVPNATLCADRDLARVGFMTPEDVRAYVDQLAGFGLVYLDDGIARDLAVIDQQRGPMAKCDWVEFGHVEFDGARIAACRLAGSTEAKIATPEGWSYAESLSRSFGFAPSRVHDKSLTFLRREDGVDVYFNKLTGKEIYVSRTK